MLTYLGGQVPSEVQGERHKAFLVHRRHQHLHLGLLEVQS